MNSLFERPHRRLNALTGEYVLVSPHRVQRPWNGRVEKPAVSAQPAYDPHCYLCPGNTRAGGERNPPYKSTYVFTNDFSAFLPQTPAGTSDEHPLLAAEAVAGTCRVVCFSPRHDLTLAQMDAAQIRGVIDTWAEQVTELEQRWRWVQVFENKGELMGCSNPHPHGQIWASDSIPNEAAKELRQQAEWFGRTHSPLLMDYANLEVSKGERVVAQNDHWLAVVPWWALWPFEILLLPRRHILRIPDLAPFERDALAEVMQQVLSAYDLLFDTSFPYSFGWHGAPGDRGGDAGYQLHAHFYPPLLRSAQVRKFMVGYEMLAEPQRDLTPEQAAERLRSVKR